jgi:hypothetical protein
LGVDQKQILKDLLRDFYDVSSVDSSAVFSAPTGTPKVEKMGSTSSYGSFTELKPKEVSKPVAKVKENSRKILRMNRIE